MTTKTLQHPATQLRSALGIVEAGNLPETDRESTLTAAVEIVAAFIDGCAGDVLAERAERAVAALVARKGQPVLAFIDGTTATVMLPIGATVTV